MSYARYVGAFSTLKGYPQTRELIVTGLHGVRDHTRTFGSDGGPNLMVRLARSVMQECEMFGSSQVLAFVSQGQATPTNAKPKTKNSNPRSARNPFKDLSSLNTYAPYLSDSLRGPLRRVHSRRVQAVRAPRITRNIVYSSHCLGMLGDAWGCVGDALGMLGDALAGFGVRGVTHAFGPTMERLKYASTFLMLSTSSENLGR